MLVVEVALHMTQEQRREPAVLVAAETLGL
jgi:hypothetical protein